MASSAPPNLTITIPPQQLLPKIITIESQKDDSDWARWYPLPDSPYLPSCLQCHLAGQRCTNTRTGYQKTGQQKVHEDLAKQPSVSCNRCLRIEEEFCVILAGNVTFRWTANNKVDDWDSLEFVAERLVAVEVKVGKWKGRTWTVERVPREEIETLIWKLKKETWEKEGKKWMLPRPKEFEKCVKNLKSVSLRFEEEKVNEVSK